MQIVVNHLTRMQPGFICAAGIEVNSRLHVRPLIDSQLTVDLLAKNGGPFELGAVLDLGLTRFTGKLPEIEDRWFDRRFVVQKHKLSRAELYQLCAEVARSSLHSIFTAALEPIGTTMAMTENAGVYSLGCLWVEARRFAIVGQEGRQRLRFAFGELDGGDRELSVPVTDIRLYKDDHTTIDLEAVQQFSQEIGQSSRTLLSVGLSRPYRKSENDVARHWLQVNNFHFPQ